MKNKLSIVLIIVFLPYFRSSVSAQTFVASHNKNRVDSLIRILDASAKLLTISSDSVFIDGKSSSWNYLYANSSFSYFYHTTYSTVILDSISSLHLIGAAIITKPWYDSDSALVLAEEQGGKDFRNNNFYYKITAGLGEPLVPNSTPRWYIYYRSTDNPSNYIFINLDATDSTLTGVKIFNQVRPNDFVLNQNYPNPFNPKTTILFSLLHSAQVNLEVFNSLGQRICSLLSNNYPMGSHRTEWDGSNQASGIYYYRLQVDDKVLCNRMILLK